MPTTNGKPTKAELEEQRIKRLEKGHKKMHDELRKQMEHRIRQEGFQERVSEQFENVYKEFEKQNKKIDDTKHELSEKIGETKHELRERSGGLEREIKDTNQKVDKLTSHVFKYALAIMGMNIALIVGIYSPREQPEKKPVVIEKKVERVAAPNNKPPTNEERARYRVLGQETRAYKARQDARITALEKQLEYVAKQKKNEPY